MFPDDELNQVLEGITTDEGERRQIASGYGKRTWGIDFKNGRIFKADPTRTKVERVIKYLLTPRGQVEVYPSFGSQDLDEGYGSLIWTMFGEVYSDAETAKGDLQAICDESALAVEGIEKVLVEQLMLGDDSIKARIRISVDSGESVTIDDIPLNI